MAVRELRLIGDPVLRSPTRTVARFDDALGRLVDDLLDTVALPGRAGLAAPQIGVDLAVFSYNVDGVVGHVVNPEIVEVDGDYDGPEACLSVPGVRAQVARYQHAVVRGVDRHGEPVVVKGQDELARCLQHEVDHLAGQLYLDRLTGERRRDALRQLRDQPASRA